MRELTVNVAITARNAEGNIKPMIRSILKQVEKSYTLKRIIVNSDDSTDNMVKVARQIKDPRVHVRDSRVRRGFAGAVIDVLAMNDADVMMVMADDVAILDKLFIEKTITPFLKEKNVGLVCSNHMPFSSGNMVQRAVTSSFNAYHKIRVKYRNGVNVHTCDGKSLTMSKTFIKTLKFPKDLSEMACTDWYVYFKCIKNGFAYRFAENAKTYYKNPATIKDYVQWTTRNNVDIIMMQEQFSKIFDEHYNFPRIPFMYYKAIEFIKNPLGCLLLFGMSIYCTIKAKSKNTKKFETAWDAVISTKGKIVIPSKL